jgi:hypothetical protein
MCDLPYSIIHVPTPRECIALCENILQRARSESSHNAKALQRKTHDETGQRRLILRHASSSSSPDYQWLNRHHEQLVKALQRGRGRESAVSTATLEVVFGDSTNNVRDDTAANRSYLLDFDDGNVICR